MYDVIEYTSDLATIAARIESAFHGERMGKRELAVNELFGFITYLRSDKAGFEFDKDFAESIGVPKSDVSKALGVIELGIPQVMAKSGRSWAVSDAELGPLVCALVDAHGGKAVSGIYTALKGKEEKVWSLAQAVATLLATATKREVALADVVAEVMGQVEALMGQ